MEKSLKKIIDHCIRNQFVSPSLDDFGILGNLLQLNLKKHWFSKNISSDGNPLLKLASAIPANPALTVDLLRHLRNARSLFGLESSLSFASVSPTELPGLSLDSNDPLTLDSLVALLPSSHLNLHMFSQPVLKVDSFNTLEKSRRRWWKFLLRHPELLVVENVTSSDPLVEQRIEIGCKDMESCPLEVITRWKPQIFEDLQIDEALRNATIVKYQRKANWPYLTTSTLRLELATWMFLADSYTPRNNTSSLSLHHRLCPFQTGLKIPSGGDRLEELHELRQLLSQQLRSAGVSVLPSGAQWSVGQCDSRSVAFLVLLDETTLVNGVCAIRSRDTGLSVQAHVSDVVHRLGNICTA